MIYPASKTPARGGFTLLELLVVITIIGILSAMSVGSFSAVVKRQKIKGTSESMQAFMTRVFAETRKYNDTLGVAANPSSFSGFRVFKNETCTGTMLFDETLVTGMQVTTHVKADLPPNPPGTIDSAWATGSVACLSFSPKGAFNPVSKPGFYEVRLLTDEDYRAIVWKQINDNRFRSAFSTNGGDSWTVN